MIPQQPIRREYGYIQDGYRLNLRAKWERHGWFVVRMFLLCVFSAYLICEAVH